LENDRSDEQAETQDDFTDEMFQFVSLVVLWC
jgi:hypothetical protein